MLKLEELSKNVAAFQEGRMSFSNFQNWFEDASSAAYENPDLRDAWIAVDAAFSEYHYDNIGIDAFRKELAEAVRPFAPKVRRVSVWKPKVEKGTIEPITRAASPYVRPKQPGKRTSSKSNLPIITSAPAVRESRVLSAK